VSHIDFAKLKEAISIQQTLDLLQIKHLQPHGEQLRGTCPLCQSTNARGFVVTPAKGTFYCFSEKKGGDLIRLAALSWRCDDRTAAVRINEQLNGGAAKADDNAPPSPKAEPPSPKSSGFEPLEYQKTLEPDHAALVPLGITADTVRHFGGGFCTKGYLRGLLALPTFEGGMMGGFFGISLVVPHELKLGKGCSPLFGTHLVTAGVARLVSHPLEVLKAYDNGVDNCLAPLAPLSWAVLTTLAELAKERDLLVEF
jgi:hypothetical protein